MSVKNYNRFSKLQRALPEIRKQMLVNQLRELEEDKILERVTYAEMPPRMEYTGYCIRQVTAAVDTSNVGLGDLHQKKKLALTG